MPRILIPLRPILGVLQIGIKSQGYRELVIPAGHSSHARQLLEQAPRSPEYSPEDHVPVYIPE
ncbi:hypothetical protein Tco_0372433, partial [Tanacetum coccineum]